MGPALLCLSFLLLLSRSSPVDTASNVVVLFANNLRTDDLSCYNPSTPVRTPNIDRLAEEGVLLAHHTAPALSPTANRAAHLTGQQPTRYGLQEGSSGVGRIQHTLSRAGLPRDVVTYSSVLRKAGYRTMATGGWELGWGCESFAAACHSPLAHGFQYFFGPPLSVATGAADAASLSLTERRHQRELASLLRAAAAGPRRYSATYRRIAETAWFRWLAGAAERGAGGVGLLGDLHKQLEHLLVSDESVSRWPYSLRGATLPILAEALDFIRDSKMEGKPFLLQHTFMQVQQQVVTSSGGVGQSGLDGAAGRYYDSLLELDAGVGRLLDLLEQLQLLDSTLVYFSADYNDLMTDVDGAGGTDSTVPGLLMLRGLVQPAVVQRPTSVLDLLPTVVDVIGHGPELLDMKLDGSSLFFALLTSTEPAKRRLFTYRGDQHHSVTLQRIDTADESIYKVYVEPTCQLCFDQTRMFNLTADPRQRRLLPPTQPIFTELLEDVRDNLFLVESVPSQLSDFWRLAPLPELFPWSQSRLYDPAVNVSSAHDLLEFLEADVVSASGGAVAGGIGGDDGGGGGGGGDGDGGGSGDSDDEETAQEELPLLQRLTRPDELLL